MKKKIRLDVLAAILFGVLLLLGCEAWAHAATYYVRPDGGTAAQCTGLANAAYSGTGTACAFNHPYQLLPPNGSAEPLQPTVMQSGDTLMIASGSYMMGYGAPGQTSAGCATPYTWDCEISNIPSGTAAAPTTITGDCAAPPELWATQRAAAIFNIVNAHDIKIACLELTDHANCIEFYKPTANTGGVTACQRDTYPYGTWGASGIYAKSVANLTLANLNIHGFADYGILAGSLSGNTTVSNVTLRANGWGGWSGDLGGNTGEWSDSGTLAFDHFVVAWNGCAEAYPATTIVGCWGQNEGGYGDGVGQSKTGGNWTFTSSTFAHNTQDGLDLLYADGTGSVSVDHSVAWQNAGNQIKTSGNASLTYSVVNGYCNNWQGFPIYGDGSSGVAGSMCRADGVAVVMLFNAAGQTAKLDHDTITGNGDALFNGGVSDNAPAGWQPDASDVTAWSNTIALGQTSVIPRDDGGLTALDWYSDGTYAGTVTYKNNVIYNVKGGFCPPGNICKDPLLKNATLAGFDPTLLQGSPAIGAGVTP